MTITKGKLMADDWGDGLLEEVGSYWTSEAVGEHNTVCISYMHQLLSMDKAAFTDWLTEHSLFISDDNDHGPDGAAFDPMDTGRDVE